MEVFLAANSAVAAFFTFTVALIVVVCIFAIPVIILLGYVWWSKRM